MQKKAIFITGAASGIGRATAVLFHQKGWFVGCYDVDEDALLILKQELGDNCLTGRLDVRDKAAFDAAMQEFAQHTDQRLDLMFNNAGIAVGGYLDELPFEKITAMVDINFTGVLAGIYAAIPLLKQTENSLCFSTSSSAATFGTPGMAVYSATKYAVKGLTEALSVELARFGSRAACMLPGIIDTPLWRSKRYVKGEVKSLAANLPKANANRTDASRTLSAEVVADCVWQAYHSDRLHWYIPEEILQRDIAKVQTPEKLRDELIAARYK